MKDKSASKAALLGAAPISAARRAVELAVTPNTRDVLGRLDRSRDVIEHRVSDLEAHQPSVLNAIASTNGATRLATREIASLRGEIEGLRNDLTSVREFTGELGNVESALSNRIAQLDEFVVGMGFRIGEGDEQVRRDLRPHIDTLGWLLGRVEMIRAEMLYELRYGSRADRTDRVTSRVLAEEKLNQSELRLNIGAGHLTMPDYVNVDMRELPGIDVVAEVDDLPFETATIDEIYTSHVIEHFPLEFLRRRLLPYWLDLLKPGALLTTITPDLGAMINDYEQGRTDFGTLRDVMYGGQEYEGDTHYTGFTPEHFCDLLVDAGFQGPTIVDSNRVNGACKEFEVVARKAGA